MKITIDVEDLDLTLSAMTHAGAALGDIIFAYTLALEEDVPHKFIEYFDKHGIKDLDAKLKHLKTRMLAFKELYYQLSEIADSQKELDK